MNVFDQNSTVAVTGANGFIGSAICNALVSENVSIVAIVEPNTATDNLKGIDCKIVEADVTDISSIEKALNSVDYLFHCAAVYKFNSRNTDLFYRVNVEGSINVIKSALKNGVKKIIYTSTVGTIGLQDKRVSDESNFAKIAHLYGNYKRSKYVAEHEVLRLTAQGAPIVLVQPTMPVGPRDRAPSPSGQMIVDFLNKRLFGYADTVLNIVDVDDVAHGHLLAMSKGEIGHSYILGGENLSMKQIIEILESITDFSYLKIKVPKSLILFFGYMSELIQGRLLSSTPRVPLEAAKMSTSYMAFDDSLTRKMLGYSSRPASQALTRSCSWYFNNGYVDPRYMDKIRFQSLKH